MTGKELSPASAPENASAAIKNKETKELNLEKLDASKLKNMRVLDLQELAQKLKIPEAEVAGIKKQDLIFKILQARDPQDGQIYGEGTLEILQDGFGFLRTPNYNY